MVNSFIFLLTITIVLLHTVFAFKEGYHTFSSRFGDNKIRYKELLPTKVNKNLPPVICIHGFGGNADQFRKNMPALAANGYRTYAIDLLGYGYSDKPNPKLYGVNEIYNFENWSEQIVQFIQDIVKQPSVLVCNSVGSCVGLQTAVTREDLVKGAVLINMSLRLLHVSKQKAFEKPIVPLLQKVLRETEVGKTFFSQIAQPKAIKNILNQAYGYPKCKGVDDETVDIILQPGLDPRAVNVFLDFISYSGGPLPEELLPQVNGDKCPVRILWGENDPWEPITMGKKLYSGFDCVDEFVPMANGGHCPMDQIEDTVNTELLRYLDTYFKAEKENKNMFPFFKQFANSN